MSNPCVVDFVVVKKSSVVDISFLGVVDEIPTEPLTLLEIFYLKNIFRPLLVWYRLLVPTFLYTTSEITV